MEDLRLRIRGLVTFLDKRKRKIVYTDFEDEVMGVRDEAVPAMPKMTGAEYERKVKSFLQDHLNHLVIRRLRTNQPLTAIDLQGLEHTLIEIGEGDGETLLSSLLARSEVSSLAHFVRELVGMDRAAAQQAFSKFLSDQSLTPPQIRFVEMIIDQLTARGVIEAAALYEAPFANLHDGGPDELFEGKEIVIKELFGALESTQPLVLGEAG